MLTPSRHAIYQDRVVVLWARSEALRFTGRAKADSRQGNPGPEGSVTKLMAAELSQDVFELALDLQGATGTLHEAGYPMTRSSSAVHHAPSGQFLRSRANTIEGGTSEIMRNILGERILGLPADIRVDKDVPWSQVPRQRGGCERGRPHAGRPSPSSVASRRGNGRARSNVRPAPDRRAVGLA